MPHETDPVTGTTPGPALGTAPQTGVEADAVEGGPARGKVVNGTVIAVAIGVMNVATYGFTIIAARELGPQRYGAFAAVMNLLLTVTVAQLALQATAARRISAVPGDVSVIEAGVRRLTWRAAVVLGVALVALAPVVNAALHLGSLTTALLVGLTAVPLTLQGGLAGILQGERRWQPLAVLYVASGVPRVLIGTGLLLWRPTELVATAAVLIGCLPPVLVGLVALRRREGHHDISDDDHGARSLTRETSRNALALLGFFAVSNVDVIVARNVLSAHEAGLYAAGLILTKVVLFLPQFVVVLAFPDMADAGARRRALRLSIGLVAALGVVAVVASWLLRSLALFFVGGHAYVDVRTHLWIFAALGTLAAMNQLLVYALLARQGSRAVHLLWLGLAAIIGIAQLADTVTQLVTIVTSVDVVMFLGLLVPAMLGKDEPAPA